eukprot:4404174-Pleurochrysis_carterae.AAC.3
MRCSASCVQDACIVNACSECMHRACGHCERVPVGTLVLTASLAMAPISLNYALVGKKDHVGSK